ncbi:hypothetical protein LshimejAT787_1601110 [Lyophyllum shimeji]|uniref:Uncharacterized protein n=1 Tax=Lyophyllum shimeji TaxID=47721 RepID=A0A9P3PYX4_LYOSH|nr:hypothetical protein LshimejAT787_1601110 [Lyophyllum shimeji]
MSVPLSEPEPPPYAPPIRTAHDETYRAVGHRRLCIESVANRPNLLGYLEYHSPTTDGSFAICIAGGAGVFVSEDLYNSIPIDRRPTLDTSDAGMEIDYVLFGTKMTAVGSTFFPFLLTTGDTNERIRVILRAYVVPDLLMGMFIGRGGLTFRITEEWGGGVHPRSEGPAFVFHFAREDRLVFGI